MAKNKTTETESNVTDFINSVEDAKRADSFRIVEIMANETGFAPKLWGPNIIGFGSYHYKYASGHEGDAPLIGFSPRKDAFALYFSSDFPNKEQLLEKFGKHKSAKACVYVKKLDDVNVDVFRKMIAASVDDVKKQYP